MTSMIRAQGDSYSSLSALSSTPGQSAPSPASTSIDKAESNKLDEASRQFEAVLLRQMLSSLERVAGTQGSKEAGSNLYGSMMVDAVADAISRAGGIGIASMLKHSLEPQLGQGASNGSKAGLPKNQAASTDHRTSNKDLPTLNARAAQNEKAGPI